MMIQSLARNGHPFAHGRSHYPNAAEFGYTLKLALDIHADLHVNVSIRASGLFSALGKFAAGHTFRSGILAHRCLMCAAIAGRSAWFPATLGLDRDCFPVFRFGVFSGSAPTTGCGAPLPSVEHWYWAGPARELCGGIEVRADDSLLHGSGLEAGHSLPYRRLLSSCRCGGILGVWIFRPPNAPAFASYYIASCSPLCFRWSCWSGSPRLLLLLSIRALPVRCPPGETGPCTRWSYFYWQQPHPVPAYRPARVLQRFYANDCTDTKNIARCIRFFFVGDWR